MKNQNFIPQFTSIHKEITSVINGVKHIIYVFKHSALLDHNGKPIPIDEFMIQSNQRVMLKPKEIIIKSPEEKSILKAAKSEYKKFRAAVYGSKANLSGSYIKINTFKELKMLKD